MGWANRVTLLRAVLTVALWVVLLVDGPAPSSSAYLVAFAMFVVTALTDAVDGMLARRLGEVSVFGRIADPLVDKLLVLGTMTVLLEMHGIPPVLPSWAVVVMLTRELLVTGLRSAVEASGRSFAAALWGKLKMLLQCIAVGAVLLWGAGFSWAHADVGALGIPGPAGHWNLAHVLVWIATIVTALSGLDYTRRAARLLLAREVGSR